MSQLLPPDKSEPSFASRSELADLLEKLSFQAKMICQTEGATVNYANPHLICALRNNLQAIIAVLRSEQQAQPSSTRLTVDATILDVAEGIVQGMTTRQRLSSSPRRFSRRFRLRLQLLSARWSLTASAPCTTSACSGATARTFHPNPQSRRY